MIRPPVPVQGSARVGAFLLWATVAAAGTGAACGPRTIGEAPRSPGRAPPPVPRATPVDSGVPARDERLPATEDSLPGETVARTLPGGTRLAFYAQPAQALVAVRLSFPLSADEGPPEALARIAQGLAREELEREAASYGAHASLDRNATEASVAITGAAADFPQLTAILRRALTWGGWSAREVATARLIAATRAGRDEETPEPLLRRQLATRLFSELPAAADSVPPKVTPGTLQHFWANSFRANHMHAVVVGGVTEAEAVAALSGWPDPAPPPATTGQLPTGRTTRAGAEVSTGAAGGAVAMKPGEGPQVLFPWAAIGWTTAADPATVAVTARLVQLRLAAEPLRSARAELWWTHGRRALVALGSATAPADSAAPTVSARLLAVVREVAGRVTPAEVAAARLAVAREILLSARTPEGLARFLGGLFDRSGDPLAAQAFLRALNQVNAQSVEAGLRALAPPVTTEVQR